MGRYTNTEGTHAVALPCKISSNYIFIFIKVVCAVVTEIGHDMNIDRHFMDLWIEFPSLMKNVVSAHLHLQEMIHCVKNVV